VVKEMIEVKVMNFSSIRDIKAQERQNQQKFDLRAICVRFAVVICPQL
jgi:hypothetical protein